MLYMGMLAVFCTNAINIYAGINGLEAGQVCMKGQLLETQASVCAQEVLDTDICDWLQHPGLQTL